MSSPTSPTISYRGPITFIGSPDCPRPSHSNRRSSLLPPPSGTFYVLLCGTTLHLYRGDPFLDLEGKEQDGAEVARLKMDERGWTVARRRSSDGRGVLGFELAQEEEELELGEKGNGNVLLRKMSTPSLASIKESSGGEKEGGARPRFADKFALRKRIKSISTTSSIFGGAPAATRAPIELVEPLVMHAVEADRWIHGLNSALASLRISLPPPPPTPKRGMSSSASLPSFSATSEPLRIASRCPLARQIAPIAPIAVPPNFNSGRRPSFLDRPPPSPRSYVNLQALASSPPREGDDLATSSSRSTVPAWLQAVRSSGTTSAMRISRSASTSLPHVKSKRSLSSLSSSGGGHSTSMERSRSDGSRPSLDSDFGPGEGSSKGGLLGFLGRKSSKGSDRPLTPSSSTRRISGPLYSQGTRSSSSLSLTDSLLSESHSTSVCSSDVHTPQFPFALDLASPLPPRSSFSSSRGCRVGTQPSKESKGHAKRSGSDGASASSRSTYRSAEDSRASDAASTPARRGGSQRGTSERRAASLSTPEGPIIEHIVKPAHLISQMRAEVEQRSRGAHRDLHFAPLRAGLSPPPRNMSRQNLSSLAANRSLAKSPSTASFLPSSPSTRAGRASLDELANPRREAAPSSSPETPKGRRSSFGRTLGEDAILEGDADGRHRVASTDT